MCTCPNWWGEHSFCSVNMSLSISSQRLRFVYLTLASFCWCVFFFFLIPAHNDNSKALSKLKSQHLMFKPKIFMFCCRIFALFFRGEERWQQSTVTFVYWKCTDEGRVQKMMAAVNKHMRNLMRLYCCCVMVGWLECLSYAIRWIRFYSFEFNTAKQKNRTDFS